MEKPISQFQIAQVKEWRNRIAFDRTLFVEMWQTIRKSMMKGAKIENGPNRAWLEHRFVLTNKGKVLRRETRLVIE